MQAQLSDVDKAYEESKKSKEYSGVRQAMVEGKLDSWSIDKVSQMDANARRNAEEAILSGRNVGSMYDPSMRISNEMRDKTAVVDTNVNIEKFGQNKTKVRFVLVEKILQNADGYSFVKSAPTNVIRLYKPNVYQEFFAQLDKSIFYEGI